MTVIKTETKKPIYCRQCHSQNSFIRYPEGDILSEKDKVLWEKWKCENCGNTTIYPVNKEK